MIKNNFESNHCQKRNEHAFSHMKFCNFQNIQHNNIYYDDRYLNNTHTGLNNNLGLPSQINDFQRRINIIDLKNYENSQINILHCSLYDKINEYIYKIPDDIYYNFNSLKNSKKKPFSPDEDEILLELVKTHGIGNWQKISMSMKKYDFTRNGRQCRDRYCHYLDPNIKTNCNWTSEEDSLILKFVDEEGKKWKKMEILFPGRTEVSLRNRYNLLIRKIAREKKKANNNNQNNCDIVEKIDKNDNDSIESTFSNITTNEFGKIKQNLDVNESDNAKDFNDKDFDSLFNESFNIQNFFEESLF